VSYGLGAPVVTVLEYRSAVLSQRFALPATLIYVTAAVQVVCVPLLFSRRHTVKAAVALTVISLGAVFSHFRIGTPLTAIPAIGFTALQIWVAARVGRGHRRGA